MASSRIPASTYRLQFHHGFRFITAQALVPYLAALGISDLYASPLFRARRRSLHGYSVTNPLIINPELGAKTSFNALARNLQSRNMGLLLDIVPNHMAMSHDNPWWLDVLENGPASPFAVFFDVDWHPPNPLLGGRVLLPILGAPYNEVLENQEIWLELDAGGLAVHYYEHRFPLDPKTYRVILTQGLEAFIETWGTEDSTVSTLLDLITLAENLPPRTAASKKKLRERNRQKDILKKNLWVWYQDHPVAQEFIDNNLTLFNGRKGEPDSFNLLDHLLNLQAYRLAHWRVAQDMINYRRFFSINDLIGLRVEDPQVFEASHGLLVDLARDGKITGLRIDHIDGLYDPQEYLERLQKTLAQATGAPAGQDPYFVVVEKILEHQETLPAAWPAAGTTGYDFLTMVDGLFVDDQGLRDLREIYTHFCSFPTRLPDVVYDKKKLIMASLFGGEVENLGYYLALLGDQDRSARDISRKDLVRTLFELTACLPVYRTYIRSFNPSEQDRKILDQAFAEVRRRQPDLNPAAQNFLRRVLFLHTPPTLSTGQKNEWLNFVMRWQQFTGPIMAKGQEDTAFYVYNPLISLNEVGSCFEAVSPAAFHEFNRQRRESWPFTLNATSTHDTKRSEDVRLRLHVLSEMPGEWEEALKLWSAWNQGHKQEVNGLKVPDASEEILLYQTILGAWPLNPEDFREFKNRVQEYLIKAAREAKVHTRWISPNHGHEQALKDFLSAILRETADNGFLQDVHKFQARLAFWGALNSLSQVLLKVASPGVPDFYQGTEIWNLSLVDPDNRRPVDFYQRSQLLNQLKKHEKKDCHGLIQELRDQWPTGALKLYVTYKALNFRRDHLDLFLHGDYLPLTAAGEREPHVVALGRRRDSQWALAVAGRMFSRLTSPGEFPVGKEVWGETALLLPAEAPSEWRNFFTGDKLDQIAGPEGPALPLKQVFRDLPVALLYGRSA